MNMRSPRLRQSAKNETIGTTSQVEGAQPKYERATINGDR